MTAHVLQFVELSDKDRKETGRLGRLAKDDQIEVHIKRRGGHDQTLSLPPEAASLIESILGHLSQGERVAVLTEDQELSPNDAASILGVSRPLVVHRMDVGDLPFRYVGKHRRSALRDVLALKTKIDAQRAAMADLCSAGSFTLRIDRTFPLDRAKEAQEVSQSGRVTGKLVVCVD